MSYTCKEGYEFTGSPVALPSPVTWIPFGGAEYYLATDYYTDSWQAARVKCQALGGDLASITSFAVQKFLTETFGELGHKKWIGGRLGGSGHYEWVSGEPVEYKHFSCGLSPSRECLAMREDDEGKWEDRDCSEDDIDRFICQRGSSNIPFWQEVTAYGRTFGQVAHLESSCVTSYQAAVASCLSYGGKIASLPFTAAAEVVEREFGPHATTDIWVGLNDIQTEGTLVWEAGETYEEKVFPLLGLEEPLNSAARDCVVLSKTDFTLKMVECVPASYYGQVCMKGGSFSKSSYYNPLLHCESVICVQILPPSTSPKLSETSASCPPTTSRCSGGPTARRSAAPSAVCTVSRPTSSPTGAPIVTVRLQMIPAPPLWTASTSMAGLQAPVCLTATPLPLGAGRRKDKPLIVVLVGISEGLEPSAL